MTWQSVRNLKFIAANHTMFQFRKMDESEELDCHLQQQETVAIQFTELVYVLMSTYEA